jgi:alpha-ketoglutaric semialdehyde dehydrogenase
MTSQTAPKYEKRSPWRPADVVGSYPACDAGDVGRAVEAGADAAGEWGARPAAERGSILHRAGELLDARVDAIAHDMTSEMGKPITQAAGEVRRAAAILRFHAGEALRPSGEVFAGGAPGQRLYTIRRPVGVVGLITPWNFPVAIPAWKLGPALVHGNPVVIKLAYDAPQSGLHLAEALAEAGLPDGVLGVVTGSGSSAGAAIVRHPDVRALSFTGSAEVGRSIREEATARGCRVQLEMGGQNPLVVMADAELDRAVEAAYAGAFLGAGQRCTATRRILVHEHVYDRFRDGLLTRVRAARVGDPHDPATEVGPLVNEQAMNDVLAAIEAGRRAGGSVAAGGERLPGDGYLVAPTVFENVGDDDPLSCEEVFGPVATLYAFATLDEALERANRPSFGLSAALFTRDLANVHHFVRELEAGVLHVNSETAGADVHVPFGGLKESGWGPHEQGRASLDFYTDVITVYEDAPGDRA